MSVPPLVWPACAMWIVAASVVVVPESAMAVAGVGVVGTAIALGLARCGGRGIRRRARSERARRVWVIVALCSLLGAFASALVSVQAPARHPAAVDGLIQGVSSDGGNARAARPAGRFTFDVLITSDPVAAAARPGARGEPGGRVRFKARLEAVTTVGRSEGRNESVDGLAVPVMVFAHTSSEAAGGAEPATGGGIAVTATVAGHPAIGERWRFEGSLQWSASEDTSAAILFARSEPVRNEEASPAVLWASALRSGFADATTVLPGDGGALLPGLSLGDTTRVGPELDEAMKASSLSHLTAVSGANCAIIVLLVLGGAARCRMTRAGRTIAALVGLGAFVMLVTPQPSVQRAAVMAGAVLIAGGLGRPARGLAALALAVVVLLTTDPWMAREIGFALSALATLGLIVLARPIAALLAKVMPTRIAMLVAIPVAAQLACQPMLLVLDPTIPVGGVPANLLAAPAAAPATVLGLLACLVTVVWPQLGLVIAWVAWLPSAWIAAVARWFAGWEHARLPWIPGIGGVLVLAVATIALAVVLILGRKIPRPVAVGCVGLVLCLAGGAAGGFIGTAVTTAMTRPADWLMAACDVGQGDAVLVRDVSGRIALIDVGPEPDVLEGCLHELGVGHIDLLVLTHYDLDHVGGLEAVLGSVDTAIVGPTADAADERMVALLRERGADVIQGRAGQTGWLGESTWSVLWPAEPKSGQGRRGGGGEVLETGNDASVIVRFDGYAPGEPSAPDPSGMVGMYDWSAVFLGDLGEDAQDRLLARHSLGGEVDVVKIAHHGSADQSDRLYRRLGATIGLLSVGADNGYGHPTPSLLDLLDAVGVAPLRTDQSGLILLAMGGDGEPSDADGRFRVWSERAVPGP